MIGETDETMTTPATLQDQIEEAMRQFGEGNRWDCVFLFSSEGFKMASEGVSLIYDQDALLEFSFSQIEAIKLLGDNPPVKEVLILGKERHRLIFRYFEGLGENLILTAVVSGRKGYRRAMANLIRFIQNLR